MCQELSVIIPNFNTQLLQAVTRSSCMRDLVCQSQGLSGGPVWSLPDIPEGDAPLPLFLQPW